jgi:poly(3-hydroxybutyrate) depolymerase
MKLLTIILFFHTIANANLPKLNIDPSSITVSGVSSGAYMAIQMHVAYSSVISGSASVSGGVYWCAKGNTLDAQIDCMGLPKSDQAEVQIQKAVEFEKAGLIDPLVSLRKHKTLIFSSSNDRVIRQKNSERLENFLKAFMPANSITHLKHTEAAHGFPTVNYGNPCNQAKIPWMINCNLDLAGIILQSFYGQLNPKVMAQSENLKSFSQSNFRPSTAFLGPQGGIYIPKSCQQGNRCRLHVALHGCQMNPDFIQDQFVKYTGLNNWAESNQIVVMYPQTAKSTRNPQACWDWFGLTGPDYVNKKGPQMQALMEMIQAVQR